MALMRDTISWQSAALVAAERTNCRLCHDPVHSVEIVNDLPNDSFEVFAKHHGKWERLFAFNPRTWEYRSQWIMVEEFVRMFPRLAFDRYTMIPLPPTMGDDYEFSEDSPYTAWADPGLRNLSAS